MAVYTKRKRERVVHEYVMPNPVCLGEFAKAMSAAYADYSQLTGKNISDDSLWVTHADEEITIYWEAK